MFSKAWEICLEEGIRLALKKTGGDKRPRWLYILRRKFPVWQQCTTCNERKAPFSAAKKRNLLSSERMQLPTDDISFTRTGKFHLRSFSALNSQAGDNRNRIRTILKTAVTCWCIVSASAGIVFWTADMFLSFSLASVQASIHSAEWQVSSM